MSSRPGSQSRRSSESSAAGPSTLPPAFIVQPRFARRVQSQTSLRPVLEDASDRSCTATPSSRRSSVFPPVSVPPAEKHGSAIPADAAGWTVDTEGLDRRERLWGGKERVILLLGDVTLEAVTHLTSDPKLSNTLLISSRRFYTGPRTTGPAIQTLQSTDIDQAITEALDISAAYRKKQRKYRSNLPSGTRGSGAKGKEVQIPFDAIIHFIPTSLRYDPRQALQRMLQEAIMATTMVNAGFASACPSPGGAAAKKSMNGSAGTQELDVPLVYVLPDDPPAALPMILDRYLAELLPAALQASAPPLSCLRPLIIPSSAWTVPYIPATSTSTAKLAVHHAVLYGHLTATGRRRRAYIPSWDEPVPSSATKHEASRQAGQGRTTPTPKQSLDLPIPVSKRNLAWTCDMDRRDSDQSTGSSSSASTPNELLTPRERSFDEVQIVKPAGGVGLEVSPLSYEEGLSSLSKSEESSKVEIKTSRGVFSWFGRKTGSKS